MDFTKITPALFVLAAAILLGGWIVYLSIRMWQQRTVPAARRVFIASVIYLPLLMGLLVVDRTAADIEEAALNIATTPAVAQLSE